MSYGVVVPNAMAGTNIDAYVRSAVCDYDLQNGGVFSLTGVSATPGGEVWTAATPATASLTNLWMAIEPEIASVTVNGKTYKGISPDPRDFYIPAGTVFTAQKLVVGDIVLMSEDAVAGTKSTNTYVVATNNTAKLTWAASAVSGVSLKLLETTYISIADGSIGSQRTTAYRFVVEALA